MPDKAVCDLDDLWCEEQITKWLVPIHEAIPLFRVTCYSIPNKLGPVHELRERYPWITFGQHGWEHSQFETRAWTDVLAKAYMEAAQEMGYAPLFKAPNWNEELFLEEVCQERGVTLHHHAKYRPTVKGLKVYPGLEARTDFESIHSHIQANPVTDFVGNHPDFKIEALSRFISFHSPIDMAVTL